MKLYTRNGDEGNTSSLSGTIYRKNDTMIECVGNADELITQVEKIRCLLSKEQNNLSQFNKDIDKITEALYLLMTELSNGKASGLTKTIQQGFVDRLEKRINELDIHPTSFVFFKTLEAIEISEARVRTRRLERELTQLLRHEVIRPVLYKYINRLSDYFFTLAVVVDTHNTSLL